jgi:hypothetical protein
MKLSDEMKNDNYNYDNNTIHQYKFGYKACLSLYLPKIESLEKTLQELLSQGVCAYYHPSCHIKCRINFDNKDCAVIKAKEVL